MNIRFSILDIWEEITVMMERLNRKTSRKTVFFFFLGSNSHNLINNCFIVFD